MKYTTSRKADKKVEKDLKIICSEIIKRYPKIKSIILTGGFSRGEGPIKIAKGKILPYNDYDIQVVSEENLSKEEVDKFSTEISKKLGYRGIENFYPFKKEEQRLENNFYIDLKWDSVENLKNFLPRIRTVELRSNSRVIYGRDLRKVIPNYKISDVPLSEGAKLLLDRMSQMIEYYSLEGRYEKEFLTYVIQQAYAACCTALLLLSKKYKIGYLKSALILKKTYKKDFPEIYEKLPKLADKVEQFIRWKVNPKKMPGDIEEEWFMAKENILEVSKYFFSKFLSKRIVSIDELASGILNMRKEFYSPYAEIIIKNKIGINLRLLTRLSLPFISLILKYKYYKRLKNIGIDKFSVLFHKSPDLVIFASLIYIIGSISKKGVNNDLLERGKKILMKAYNCKGKNWEELSEDYTNAYIAFFLQKI